MLGIRKKHLSLSILLLMSCVFFSCNRTFAQTFDSSFSPLSTTLSATSPSSVREIVANYCTAVLSSSRFLKDGFVYTPKYSAFIYLLCTKTNSVNSNNSYFAGVDFVKRKNFQQLGLTDIPDTDGYDMCANLGNDCNIAKIVPKLFNDIMVDYVNMKQSNIYGLSANFANQADIEKQVATFSLANFGINICEKTTRYYSVSCRSMQSYIQNARNLLSDVNIFVASGVLQTVPSVSCEQKNLDYNLFVCGLYGDTGASLQNFVNLSYNELYYYRLFTAYYLMIIQKNPGILGKNIRNTKYSTISQKLSSEYIRSKSALSLTFRMLRDTYVVFPFHIGLLMYQEDLDKFGKVLAGIATPIYTLYDKLRNVQKPQ